MEVTIVYWRDIPAQVIVGKGRRAVKVQLSKRFEKAIDHCAMKVGAIDSDSYLSEWQKKKELEVNSSHSEAPRIAESIEKAYDKIRLKNIIANDGWDQKSS